MKLILDTHTALWWLLGDAQANRARQVIEDTQSQVYVSQATLWEVAIKAAVGKMPVAPARFAEQVPARGFFWLPIDNEHLIRSRDLALLPYNKDPFDRLLVSQAIATSSILITADKVLANYGSHVRVV